MAPHCGHAQPAVHRGRSATISRSSGLTLKTSVITMREKRSHYEAILDIAQRHSAPRDAIIERAVAYLDYDPTVRPDDR